METHDDILDSLPQDWCQFCGGDLMLLGQLGRRTHLRCRNCGMDWSFEEEAA